MPTTVNAGNSPYIVSAGTDTGDDVQSGGTIVVLSTGTIADTIVSNGGEAIVSSGGIASHTILNAGGHQFVFDSGTTISTVVDGLQIVSAGGTASSTTIDNGGFDQVYGSDFNATVSSGGEQDVFSGGTASGTTVLTSGVQSVFLGGTASGTLVSGGHQYIEGSATSTMLLFNGVFGVQTVASGGSASFTSVGNGAFQTVNAGGSASSAVLLSGGQQDVSGTATNTVINHLGFGYVHSGGSVISTIVYGLETVSGGGSASFTTIQSGGFEQVYGSDSNATVSSGGEQDVFSGGTASGTTVLTSGVQSVFLGGTASGTLVSGGHQYVEGSATSTMLLFNGVFGAQTVASGGSASFTSVGNGAFQTVNSGGSAISAVVLSGGQQDVSGTATNTVINNGGTQNVSSGGTLIDTVISSGGNQYVFGGTASNTVIFSGGNAFISGGTASGDIIMSGGTEKVFLGGHVVSTIVSNGGTEFVSSGGTASGTVVLGGGTTVISSGGIEVAPVISGGKLELVAGAVLSGAVSFAGTSGTLRVDGTSMPINTISGFVPGDVIDLAGIGFDSNGTVTLTSGNVLQISENSHVYQLQLDPSVNLTGEQFVLSSDGSGGSDIGRVSPAHTVIETYGATRLTQVGNEYFLLDSSDVGPALSYGGTPETVGLEAPWRPIGAEQTASGYEVAWKNRATGQYIVWNTDSSGNYLSDTDILSRRSPELEVLETSFQQDLNNDGTIGPNLPSKVIETFGSTHLTRIGHEFFLLDSGGSGPVLREAGVPVMTGQNIPWVPIGAEQIAGGYEVAWKNRATGQYLVWNTDSSGNYVSYTGVLSGTSSELQSFESSSHQDLNGDGIIDPVIVAAGTTFELASAYSGAVTFTGSSGTLKLDQSSTFSGTVTGLTGADTIDFADLNFATAQQPTFLGTSSGGVLTVTDGTHTSSVHLVGDYTASTWTISNDGSGGIDVVDPPLSSLVAGSDAIHIASAVGSDGTGSGTPSIAAFVDTSNGKDSAKIDAPSAPLIASIDSVFGGSTLGFDGAGSGTPSFAAFGSNGATNASSGNSSSDGSSGKWGADVALFANYMASSFATPSASVDPTPFLEFSRAASTISSTGTHVSTEDRHNSPPSEVHLESEQVDSMAEVLGTL